MPTWVKSYQQFYAKYGGRLALMGLTNKDIGVYMFLFTQKWIERKPPVSSFQITKTLISISGFLPKDFRIKYSAKSVGISLNKLVTMGFVLYCKNTKKIKSEGRPATALYEPNQISQVMKNIDDVLKNYKKNISYAISNLEAIEEGIALRDNEGIIE